MGKVDFEELFTTYSKRLTLLAYSYTKDWHTAEDVVQESFIKAFKKIDTIEYTEKICAWLSAITVRTAIDYLRAAKRHNRLTTDSELLEYLQCQLNTGTSTEEQVEMLLFKEVVCQSMFQISEDYKQVLFLKIELGLKEQEIASVLQLKSTTVKTRLHRARKQLKQVVTEKFSA
ncbi:RNA polymerase sigma factor [Mesobacillus maritimus]|uniref:RNA polymerase sigma factor n=1 Tax=Mesobacillus maritimus TaxID=1643336 RepID=UPI002041AAF4|nr:RNA polymerase sigma factor [Mesobacillus maritimus]MCM3669390.1 RNA polymerase sigma factor [Mesobacillus maritimus]